MTADILIVSTILLLSMILLCVGRIAIDLVAVMVVISLVVTRLMSPAEAFSGFGDPIVLAIGSLFVVSGGLHQAGLSSLVGRRLAGFGRGSEKKTILAVMLSGALLSSVMTNGAATAILLPAVMAVASRSRLGPSRLLIPLSYGTVLGGTLTIVGTQPNIVVSSMLMTDQGREIGFFAFTPVSLAVLVAGIVYMIWIGSRFLPKTGIEKKDRIHPDAGELPGIYRLGERFFEVQVENSSGLCGRSLTESRFGSLFGITVIAIIREKGHRIIPRPDDIIMANDRLLLQGREEDVSRASSSLGFGICSKSNACEGDIVNQGIGMVEVILPPRSPYIGKRLQDIRIREKHGLTVLGIWRGGKPIRAYLAKESLHLGDALLLRGKWENILLLNKSDEFLVVSGIDTPDVPADRSRMIYSIAILVAMLLSVSLKIISLPIASFSAAFLMILSRCLTPAEAYKAIEWRVVVLIAGFIPLGSAMVKTGMVDYVVNMIFLPFSDAGPVVIVGLFLFLSTVLALFTSNITAAILLSPVALAAAASIQVQPEMFLAAVALGASNGFMTPVAQQGHLLVMGAGDYHFWDYVKTGFGLTLVVFLILIALIPIMW